MQKCLTGWRQWTLAFLFWLPFQASASDLIITGIIDGPLTGGTPKALELYAVNAIADLSIYGLGSATNGNPSSGVDFTLSGSATAGEFLYVASESTQFTNFFGFAPTFTNSVMNINGDDAIELFQNGAVVDVYGVVGVDGSGEPWDHLDGWAYRNAGTTATTSFVPADWTFSGTNALDGETSNATAATPFPIGTYTTGGTTPPPPPPAAMSKKIHEIQGAVDQNLLDGQVVTIEAIVVGDFQDGDADNSRNLRGFYVQEEDADVDGNPATSEGIFIFEGGNTNTDVNVGDLVQVTGTVDEHFDETQIDTVTNITVLSSNNPLPTAATIDLPAAAVSTAQDGDYQPDLEAFEGMLVTFADPLTITEMFNLDRFNEIKLVEGNRPQQFTQNNAPDAAGFDAYLQALGARTITYDDGLNQQNASIGNLDGFGPTFSTASDIRMGDTISNLTGVLSYQWAGNSASQATWRVRSTANGTNQVTKVNNRPVTPDAVGGTLKVVSLNVLNYFTTLDEGSNKTDTNQDPRGADNQDEFDRQTEKLISTLRALDADVLGLLEVENSGSNAALANIVNELNTVLGAGSYAYVATDLIGGDAIAVGFIYKTSTVRLKGNFAILDSTVDADFVDTKNRPALAQTFTEIRSGESFTAVINHLKSKGSSCASIGDPDGTGGEGNCNGTRTKAAQALADWLATDPTASNDPDFLILGDLNSYAAETPITTLEAAGYTDLARQFVGADAYSYVFDGQVGTLDYALANASLLSQVSGATEWHVNADEADAIDYNLDFGRDPSIFAGTVVYRNSDHDPVIVGLALRSGKTVVVNDANDLVNAVKQAFSGDTLDLTNLSGSLNLPETLVVTTNLTIKGASAQSLAITGNNQRRIFEVEPGASLILNDVSLERGNARQSFGGAISNEGDITLNRVMLRGNYSSEGGAIYNTPTGTLTIANSLIYGNLASNNGGAIYNAGDLSLMNVTLVFNRALGEAGGIYNNGQGLAVFNSLVWNNQDDNGRSEKGTPAISVTDVTQNFFRQKSLIQGFDDANDNLDGQFDATNYPGLERMANVRFLALPSFIGNYAPAAGSLIRDAGDDQLYSELIFGDVDFLGAPRINGSAINIGAFEE